MKGNSVRHIIDRMVIENGMPKALKLCEKLGIVTSQSKLRGHCDRHSPYVKQTEEIVAKAVREAVGTVNDSVGQAFSGNDVIEEIINRGGKMIVEGSMPVTERLLSTALKEEGARKSGGSLRDLLKTLDKKKFKPVDGELIEDAPKETILLDGK